MLNTLFNGIFDSVTTQVISVPMFLLDIFVALLAGVIISFSYSKTNTCSKSFSVTLAMLPALVAVVIMMVNGNIGAGVAIAGAFGLIRFRSAQGTAKEIAAVFMGMAAGLVIGMGYLAYGILFSIIMCVALLAFSKNGLLSTGDENRKQLKITIPENLDFDGAFDDLFERYAEKFDLISVKTANMGSLYKLNYNVVMKTGVNAKEFMDEIRCRNGNLEVALSKQEVEKSDL